MIHGLKQQKTSRFVNGRYRRFWSKKEIKNSSIKSLDDTIRDISKTSGGHIGKLQLEMDVKEQDVEEFIRRITRAKYDVDGLLLNEESQGLGFSNLIYLHMRLEEFYKSIDKNKVNVFFIEEPESHMHPQMQNVFIRFLKNYYIDKNYKGLLQHILMKLQGWLVLIVLE